MTLLDRLREAVASDYDVLEEIGRGGAGVVFRAFDRALARPVALKVLRPEQASARSVERFLREARSLAAVDHPRVVGVHHAGEAGGLFYFVMELLEGETLADRLGRGPLSGPELDVLADDLLSALGALHDVGIVHRDVKPSNIFLVEGRAVLGDLGIARGGTGEDRLTASGQTVGTPRYLAPEQRHGEASEATDVYAAALVLYEASVAVPWRDRAGSPSAWSGVPRRYRGPLRRALHPDPESRWPDAGSFRSALKARPSLRFQIVAGGVAGAFALLGLVLLLGRPSESGAADLAVLPFEVVVGRGAGTDQAQGPCNPDTHAGCQLASLVTMRLQDLPQLKVIPQARLSRMGAAGTASLDDPTRRSLHSRYLSRGSLDMGPDGLELVLVVEDSLGEWQAERTITAGAGDLRALADSVALHLLTLIQPRLVPALRGIEGLPTRSVAAWREYFRGENAFFRNAWTSAEEHYRRALALDSTFALAEWRLWNVYRWRLTGEEVVDLGTLLAKHGDDLPPVERALLATEAQDPGIRRIEALTSALDEYGYVAFTHWLLADELHHRGPLIGRPLDQALREYREAAARNPYLGPIYEHSIVALIRLGREAEAREALDSLWAVAAPRVPGEALYFPGLLELGFLERFDPDSAALARARVFPPQDPATLTSAVFAARMGLLLDVPAAQLELGRLLTAAPPTYQSSGYTARALALTVMGRPLAALASFDSAAAVAPGAADRGNAGLAAAEWRVILPALGVFNLPAAERDRGRRVLREEAGTSSDRSSRAAWALALDRFAAGDLEAGTLWLQRIGPDGGDPEEARLHTLARAFGAYARGEYSAALGRTRPLLEDQFLPRDRDPFTRTVLHLTRAASYEAMGDTARALGERLWSDNWDQTRVLDGPLQTVEVDWAASPYSDRVRARHALADSDTTEACRLLERLAWLWTEVEPALEASWAEDRQLESEVCR